MKIESNNKPAFVPVTFVLETEQELLLIADFFGRSSGMIGELYNLPKDFIYDEYRALKAILDGRGMKFPNKINVTVK